MDKEHGCFTLKSMINFISTAHKQAPITHEIFAVQTQNKDFLLSMNRRVHWCLGFIVIRALFVSVHS